MKLGDMFLAYQQKFDVESKPLARELGISESTLCRVKQGRMPDAAAFARIVLWMTKP